MNRNKLRVVNSQAHSEPVDALVVGAGFAGLYQLHKLRQSGLKVRLIERGEGVGGTWYWNRYPGARCDVPSFLYSVSYLPDLDQEWDWPELFSPHGAIRSYLEEIVRRLDLRRDMTFGTSLQEAVWDHESSTWTVRTDTGEQINTRYLVMATGNLSAPKDPDFPGLESFGGRWFHTGRWPHEEVDFTGRRVAVIGTGSTGVQTVPIVAEQAAAVTVVQRTPKFVLAAKNRLLDDEFRAGIKSQYVALRQAVRHTDFGLPDRAPSVLLTDLTKDERRDMIHKAWAEGTGSSFTVSHRPDLAMRDQEVNDIVADLARQYIRDTVDDPEIAEILTPYGYPIGINRLIVGTDYYESFNRDNVVLHDALKDPIVEITPTGIRTKTKHIEVDDIIFATGYDGLTGALTSVRLVGEAGISLDQQWHEEGPSSYLGVQIAGYPNLFTVTGPGSPSVLANVVTTIEQGVEFITDLIDYTQAHGYASVQPDPGAESKWMDHVGEIAENSLYRHAVKANSWYTGANIPGKKVVFMPYAGGVGKYGEILEDIATDDYRGFVFTS
jgi:cation diffusion facilitator CzcD-associated flavoprotein CzcO